MADISKIKLPGIAESLNIKDATARQMIENLPTPMQFKGTLGVVGTYTKETLPAAATSNTGWTLKVITEDTYHGVAAKVGDTLISNGTAWVCIPSGDEPSGTVTNVATGTGLTGGPITSSGTISLNEASIASLAKADNAIANPSSKDDGQYLMYNGSNWVAANVDALPSQSGQSGKYLTTNGTAASWATVPITVTGTTDPVNCQYWYCVTKTH